VILPLPSTPWLSCDTHACYTGFRVHARRVGQRNRVRCEVPRKDVRSTVAKMRVRSRRIPAHQHGHQQEQTHPRASTGADASTCINLQQRMQRFRANARERMQESATCGHADREGMREHEGSKFDTASNGGRDPT